MSVLTSLVRPHLREFKNRELNPPKLLPSGAVPKVKLNQNENYETRDWEYAAYPEYQHPKLLKALSRAYGVPQEWMKITHGADTGIHCLNELFCEPGSRIMVHTPTFFAYETYARKFQASAEDSPLIHANDEYSLGTQEILNKIKTSSNGLKAIYLCNPNNPTGTYFPEDEVLDIRPVAKVA